MRTYVYIDGFNFYNGAVKDTAYKWLDFKALFSKLLPPTYHIEKIKYFTAEVKPLPHDPDVAIRQQTYLRALKKYIPEIEIYKGYFSSHVVRMPLAVPASGRRFESVIKTEEKGSDSLVCLRRCQEYDFAYI